jgi:capsular polysaccharide biosynthesis protein
MVNRSFGGVSVNRALPVNVRDRDKSLFERLQVARIEPIIISELRNANVLYDGTIYQGWHTVEGMLLRNDDGEVVPYSWIDLVKIFLRWPTKRIKNRETFIAIHNNFSNTYYHWITEALPRLYLLKDQIAQSTLLLPDNHDRKFHAESLKIFGVDKILWMKEKVRYCIADLAVSSQIGRIANYHPEVICEMVAHIKDRIGLNTNLGNKLYITRRNSSRRRVVNEGDLETGLLKAGFRIIDLEEFSFAEQASIMHHCRFMVGVHGAGLANMIFMQAGSHVLELRKEDKGTNYFYFSLASTVNHRYYYQSCESVEPGSSVQDADIRVDVDLFMKNIDLMLGME